MANDKIFKSSNCFDRLMQERYNSTANASELYLFCLTHWGRVTHKCGSKPTNIGSDNGLSPRRRQAIIWTNAGILLIGPFETNFSGILIGIQTFSLKKMQVKMSSAKWHLFCLGLNVLNEHIVAQWHHKVTWIWVNIDSGNGLLPDNTKPLPEPLLIEIVAIILQKMCKICHHKSLFQIKFSKMFMHLLQVKLLVYCVNPSHELDYLDWLPADAQAPLVVRTSVDFN